jgi:hypothetical protein
MRQHYAETKYGFEWGSAHVQRAFSDDKRGEWSPPNAQDHRPLPGQNAIETKKDRSG